MALRRCAAYAWASPPTLLGLAVAVAVGARWARRDGVLEACGPGVARWFTWIAPGRSIAAMTLGHVVLGRDALALDETRAHERVHVAQYERWGPVFLPAYLGASLLAWLAGGDLYADNWFEREAWALAPRPTPPRASPAPRA
jgi:hypothetical protein